MRTTGISRHITGYLAEDVNRSQATDLLSYHRLPDGRKLQVSIHFDHFYKNQSRANVCLWDGGKWNEVASMLSRAIKCDTHEELNHLEHHLLDLAINIIEPEFEEVSFTAPDGTDIVALGLTEAQARQIAEQMHPAE